MMLGLLVQWPQKVGQLMLMMLAMLCAVGENRPAADAHDAGLVGAAPQKRPADAHDAGHVCVRWGKGGASDAHAAGLPGGMCSTKRPADAHDAGHVVCAICGKTGKHLMLMMLV